MAAIQEMRKIIPQDIINEKGIMTKGVIVRDRLFKQIKLKINFAHNSFWISPSNSGIKIWCCPIVCKTPKMYYIGLQIILEKRQLYQ